MNFENKSTSATAAPRRPSPIRRLLRWLGRLFSLARTSIVMLLFVGSLGMFVGGIAVAASKVLFNLASNAASLVSSKTVRTDHQSNLSRTQSQHAAELGERDRRIARQLRAISAHETTIARLSSENIDLRQRSIVTYRGAPRTAGEAASDTAKRVSRRVARATTRNIAAMPAEALPFFGMAVIAGATAWELNDACELMKDMRALDAAFNPSNPISEDEVCGIKPMSRAEIWIAIRESPTLVWETTRRAMPDLDLPQVALPAIPAWLMGGWQQVYCSTIGGEDCES